MTFNEKITILKRLFKNYIKRYLNLIFVSLFLSLIVAGSTSTIAWLLDPAVKKVFVEKDYTYSWLIPLLIIIAFSSKGLSLYSARLILAKISLKIVGKMKSQLASYIIDADINTLEKKHSGAFISSVSYDTALVQNLVGSGFLSLMKDTLSLIALVGVMFYQNWQLALFAILMIPLAGGFAKNLGKRMGKVTLQASESSAILTSFLNEIYKSVKMIKIYQQEEKEKKRVEEATEKLVNKEIKMNKVLLSSTPIMEILTGFMIAGFIVFAGRLINAGQLEINQFFSFLAAMMLAYQPIRALATINMNIASGTAASKRIFFIIDQPISVTNNMHLPNLKLNKCNIEFKNVSFKYDRTEEKAVNNVNIQALGGSMTAFVGHSGAGKSTIINLIPRFYTPQNGKILVDGQNIENINLNSLRKNISLVSQDVILFDDTIISNISYANDNASEKEIYEACKFAAADEFINQLPQKYNTKVGENGLRLSGGQKQRISIARAVLKNSPIILLDEATSSLDAVSEEIVQNAIKNLTKNKTTLVIAHRLSTIHNADKIIVLKKGKIVDQGKHDVLIKNCEEYKNLYQKQLK